MKFTPISTTTAIMQPWRSKYIRHVRGMLLKFLYFCGFCVRACTVCVRAYVRVCVPDMPRIFSGGGVGGGGPVGGGGTLIFSYIRRLESFFGVQNVEFQYFWGFSEKLIFSLGMKILWIFFLVSSQNWTIFSGHFYVF